MSPITHHLALGELLVLFVGAVGYSQLSAVYRKKRFHLLTLVFTALLIGVLLTVKSAVIAITEPQMFHGIGTASIGTVFLVSVIAGKRNIARLEKRIHEQGEVLIDGR